MDNAICSKANAPPFLRSVLYVNPSTFCSLAIFKVIISQAAPWGKIFPPKLIPSKKAINMGLGTISPGFFRKILLKIEIKIKAVGVFAKKPDNKLDMIKTRIAAKKIPPVNTGSNKLVIN